METRKALFPADSHSSSDQIRVSPGLVVGNLVFVTGMTGSKDDGSMPADLDDQFRRAFDKIGTVLREAGLGFDAVIEMTSYHLGLRDHFDRFNAIRSEYVREPYPAWTAVEVAGLRRDGAVVEIKVIAAA